MSMDLEMIEEEHENVPPNYMRDVFDFVAEDEEDEEEEEEDVGNNKAYKGRKKRVNMTPLDRCIAAEKELSDGKWVSFCATMFPKFAHSR